MFKDEYYGPRSSSGQRHGNGLHTFSNGSLYMGDQNMDERSGQGVFLFSQGEVLEGQWSNNQLHGVGTSTDKEGKIYYGQFIQSNRDGVGQISDHGAEFIGQFRVGKRNGVGMHRDGHKNKIVKGYYENGALHGFTIIKILDQKYVYTGSTQGSLLHGLGEEVKDGSTYLGQFEKGVREGIGYHRSRDNVSFLGEYVQGQKNGFGIEEFPAGVYYEGQFKNGVKNGIGKLVDPNKGLVYIGELGEHSLPEGFGQFQTQDVYYIGHWRNGKRQGLGYQRQSNGHMYFGEWHSDLRQGRGYSEDSTLEYKGTFMADVPHGLGIAKINKTAAVVAEFSKGVLIARKPQMSVNEVLEKYRDPDFKQFETTSVEKLNEMLYLTERKREAVMKRFYSFDLDFKSRIDNLNLSLQQVMVELEAVSYELKRVRTAIREAAFTLDRNTRNVLERHLQALQNDPQTSRYCGKYIIARIRVYLDSVYQAESPSRDGFTARSIDDDTSSYRGSMNQFFNNIRTKSTSRLGNSNHFEVVNADQKPFFANDDELVRKVSDTPEWRKSEISFTKIYEKTEVTRTIDQSFNYTPAKTDKSPSGPTPKDLPSADIRGFYNRVAEQKTPTRPSTFQTTEFVYSESQVTPSPNFGKLPEPVREKPIPHVNTAIVNKNDTPSKYQLTEIRTLNDTPEPFVPNTLTPSQATPAKEEPPKEDRSHENLFIPSMMMDPSLPRDPPLFFVQSSLHRIQPDTLDDNMPKPKPLPLPLPEVVKPTVLEGRDRGYGSSISAQVVKDVRDGLVEDPAEMNSRSVAISENTSPKKKKVNPDLDPDNFEETPDINKINKELAEGQQGRHFSSNRKPLISPNKEIKPQPVVEQKYQPPLEKSDPPRYSLTESNKSEPKAESEDYSPAETGPETVKFISNKDKPETRNNELEEIPEMWEELSDFNREEPMNNFANNQAKKSVTAKPEPKPQQEIKPPLESRPKPEARPQVENRIQPEPKQQVAPSALPKQTKPGPESTKDQSPHSYDLNKHFKPSVEAQPYNKPRTLVTTQEIHETRPVNVTTLKKDERNISTQTKFPASPPTTLPNQYTQQQQPQYRPRDPVHYDPLRNNPNVSITTSIDQSILIIDELSTPTLPPGFESAKPDPRPLQQPQQPKVTRTVESTTTRHEVIYFVDGSGRVNTMDKKGNILPASGLSTPAEVSFYNDRPNNTTPAREVEEEFFYIDKKGQPRDLDKNILPVSRDEPSFSQPGDLNTSRAGRQKTPSRNPLNTTRSIETVDVPRDNTVHQSWFVRLDDGSEVEYYIDVDGVIKQRQRPKPQLFSSNEKFDYYIDIDGVRRRRDPSGNQAGIVDDSYDYPATDRFYPKIEDSTTQTDRKKKPDRPKSNYKLDNERFVDELHHVRERSRTPADSKTLIGNKDVGENKDPTNQQGKKDGQDEKKTTPAFPQTSQFQPGPGSDKRPTGNKQTAQTEPMPNDPSQRNTTPKKTLADTAVQVEIRKQQMSVGAQVTMDLNESKVKPVELDPDTDFENYLDSDGVLKIRKKLGQPTTITPGGEIGKDSAKTPTSLKHYEEYIDKDGTKRMRVVDKLPTAKESTGPSPNQAPADSIDQYEAFVDPADGQVKIRKKTQVSRFNIPPKANDYEVFVDKDGQLKVRKKLMIAMTEDELEKKRNMFRAKSPNVKIPIPQECDFNVNRGAEMSPPAPPKPPITDDELKKRRRRSKRPIFMTHDMPTDFLDLSGVLDLLPKEERKDIEVQPGEDPMVAFLNSIIGTSDNTNTQEEWEEYVDTDGTIKKRKKATVAMTSDPTKSSVLSLNQDGMPKRRKSRLSIFMTPDIPLDQESLNALIARAIAGERFPPTEVATTSTSLAVNNDEYEEFVDTDGSVKKRKKTTVALTGDNLSNQEAEEEPVAKTRKKRSVFMTPDIPLDQDSVDALIARAFAGERFPPLTSTVEYEEYVDADGAVKTRKKQTVAITSEKVNSTSLQQAQDLNSQEQSEQAMKTRKKRSVFMTPDIPLDQDSVDALIARAIAGERFPPETSTDSMGEYEEYVDADGVVKKRKKQTVTMTAGESQSSLMQQSQEVASNDLDVPTAKTRKKRSVFMTPDIPLDQESLDALIARALAGERFPPIASQDAFASMTMTETNSTSQTAANNQASAVTTEDANMQRSRNTATLTSSELIVNQSETAEQSMQRSMNQATLSSNELTQNEVNQTTTMESTEQQPAAKKRAKKPVYMTPDIPLDQESIDALVKRAEAGELYRP
jgi:hypothetical protein